MTEAEVEQVAEALHSGWITTGPKTKEFEKLIALVCSSQKVVCLNSATAAMEMALRLIDVGPEDEVIVPAYTYTATASVTQHVGCKVVMVDSQKDNVEMDYDKLANAITEHTKVIMPVDLGGIICDFDKVFEIVEAKKHLFHPTNAIQKKIGRIIVAADDAHAFGAKRYGKMAGEIADFSSFSFHAVKNLTTAEGGALTWHLPFGNEPVLVNGEGLMVQGYDYMPNVPKKEGETWNELLYRISQLFSLHGQNKDALAKTQLGAWEYDIIGPWYKCNMTDVVAGIGLAQLKRYPEMLYRRRQMIGRYNEAIDKLNANLDATHQVKYLNHYGENHSSSGHLYITRLLGRTDEERRVVIIEMAKRGIACNVHYKPLPMMTAYKALGFDINDYPNAYHLFENEITLPLHTKLTDEDVEYVISNFVDIVKNL
jgi:dTDP-4-amino-4,6-dideoxygalactose transaminase